MIVFRGAMSSECKRHIIKHSKKRAFIFGAVISAIFVFPVIYAAIYWDLLALSFLFLLAAFPWLCAVTPTKETLSIIIPWEVAIDAQENRLLWESSKLQFVKSIEEDVRDVTDMGDCYVIRFCFSARCIHVVCEKRLLCEGTLEAFEKVFEDNLIPIQRKEKGNGKRYGNTIR